MINSQMELSLLSDGLVKPFPEEEVRELGGGDGGTAHTIKNRSFGATFLI